MPLNEADVLTGLEGLDINVRSLIQKYREHKVGIQIEPTMFSARSFIHDQVKYMKLEYAKEQ